MVDKKADDYSQLLKSFNQQLGRVRRISNVSSINTSDLSRIKASRESQIKLQGLSDYYDMRKEWNDLLKLALKIILGFNITLVVAVGLGWLKYADEWFLRIVLTTNLADIIGLFYLVVKFLFSDRPSDNTKSED